MAKCKSWRYTTVKSHQGHLPGACRECWRPCTQKVDRGVQRCHDCLVAVLTCPDTQVRRSLLAEPHVDAETLELLADDMNPVLASTARARLEQLRLEEATHGA